MMSTHLRKWSDWLTEGQFYVFGGVYMMVRIAVNVTMSIQPFYLILVTGFEQSIESPTPLPLALTPLVSYTTSLIFSLFFYKKLLRRYGNRLIPLAISVVVISLGSIPYLFLNSDPAVRWLVYVLSSI